MNIDPSTPAREVLIRYLESSGVNQQKEAAAEMRKMEEELRQAAFDIADIKKDYERKHQISVQLSIFNETLLIENSMLKFKAKPSLTSRIALWLKKGK